MESKQPVRRTSSTSSAFLTSTISTPNVDSIIDAVATILHSQMLEDQNVGKTIPKGSVLYYFSEEKYIEQKPDAFDQNRLLIIRQMPSVENIYEFIKALYDCAQFSPECVIISLVYINRLIAYTGVPLNQTNWRPIILCSLLVAQKVWDDRYLSNSDFAFIYPFFVLDEINMLELKFLELLEYTVTVKASLYAKYFFELRALQKDNEKEMPLKPLDLAEAEKLQIVTGKYQESFEAQKKKRSNSVDKGSTVPEKKLKHSGKFIIN